MDDIGKMGLPKMKDHLLTKFEMVFNSSREVIVRPILGTIAVIVNPLESAFGLISLHPHLPKAVTPSGGVSEISAIGVDPGPFGRGAKDTPI